MAVKGKQLLEVDKSLFAKGQAPAVRFGFGEGGLLSMLGSRVGLVQGRGNVQGGRLGA